MWVGLKIGLRKLTLGMRVMFTQGIIRRFECLGQIVSQRESRAVFAIRCQEYDRVAIKSDENISGP